MYKILKNIIEMDDYSVQKLNSQPPEPYEWETVEGTEIDVSDSAEYRGKIEVKGNTEQEQLSGKNKLPNITNSITIAGVTYTLNEDKSITIDGSATSQSNKYFVGSSSEYEDIGLTPGDYMLSGLNQADDTVMRLYCVKKDVNNEITTYLHFSRPTMIPINEGDTFRIFIRVLNGENVNNVTIYPQLEQGSTATDYEPYCGGQASPNPDYPQEIKVVTGTNVIKHCNKNLLNIENITGYTFVSSLPINPGIIQIDSYDKNNVSFTSIANAFRLVMTNVLKLKPNTSYTLSYTRKNNLTEEAAARRFIYSVENGTYQIINILNAYDENNMSITFNTTETGLIALAWGFNNKASGSSSVISNIQIEEGSTATDYEPYQVKNYSLNLGNIELCKIGDYQDILFKNVVGDENYNAELENGAWYKKNVLNKVIFNGTEEWATDNQNELFKTNLLDLKSNTSTSYVVIGVCSHFVPGSLISSRSHSNQFSNYGYQILFNKNNMTLEEWAEWLNAHNLLVYYLPDNTTYTKITDPTLISQLEALNKAKWLKGVNHWFTETENLEPNLKGTYKQSNNLRIKALEQAIVALGGV